MISFEDAHAQVLALASPLEAERVHTEHALGRVLTAPVVTPRALPAFDASTMDGYAVRIADLVNAPRDGQGNIVLPRLGESRAGHAPPALAARSTMRIFTGAPIPAGADAVIMQERATPASDAENAAIHFQEAAHASLRPGAFIRRAGDDLGANVEALRAGTRLGAAHISLLAALGVAEVEVHRAPRVAVVPTGDEVFSLGAATSVFGVTDTLGPTLAAMGKRDGFLVTASPPLRDDRALLEARFEELMAHSDVLVTIGGVSVGDHDLVRPVLERMGVSLRFFKVALRPGKPITVGVKGPKLVFGLPGNPASALVTFALFARPALFRMLGADPRLVSTPVRLGAAVSHEPGRRTFYRAIVEDGVATVPSQQSSGSALSIARANALLTIPADVTSIAAGEMATAYMFDRLGLG